MQFTVAKFLQNNLKKTGNMAIFILLCKITIHYPCKHAHNKTIAHLVP